MKKSRIVLSILAIIPIALLMDKFFFHPGNYDEDSIGLLIYLVIGIPSLILNIWAWGAPETIGAFFFKNDK